MTEPKKKKPKGGNAVMASRVAVPDGLDYFPTPPWATRAFCHHALGLRPGKWMGPPAYDPCCGEGHMAVPLREYFGDCHASDIYPYGFGAIGDFLDLTLGTAWTPPGRIGWIVTNPPFNKAMDILDRALRLGPQFGVALLLRSVWEEGGKRYREIFSGAHRPHEKWVSADRIPMVQGRYDPKVKSATAYSWFVWRTDSAARPAEFTRMNWIPPGQVTAFFRATDPMIAVPQTEGERLL